MNYKIFYDVVYIYIMNLDSIIHVLSIVLPFINEIANILTSSGLSIFKNLYKQCIDPYLLDSVLIDMISNKKLCRGRDVFSKIMFDLLSLLGIILMIGKNSIKYGYLTGIATGLVIIFLGFITPNLILHRSIHAIMHFFKFKSPYMSIIIGFTITGMLMLLSLIIEDTITEATQTFIIDPELEVKKEKHTKFIVDPIMKIKTTKITI
jgi:hypothetical protein